MTDMSPVRVPYQPEESDASFESFELPGGSGIDWSVLDGPADDAHIVHTVHTEIPSLSAEESSRDLTQDDEELIEGLCDYLYSVDPEFRKKVDESTTGPTDEQASVLPTYTTRKTRKRAACGTPRMKERRCKARRRI